MLRVQNLHIPLDADEDIIKKAAARVLKVREKDIRQIYIVRKSVDARKKDNVHFVVSVDVKFFIPDEKVLKRVKGDSVQQSVKDERIVSPKVNHLVASPVVVGLGPGGLFAALYLARAGCKPIVIERGEPVEKRIKTVRRFMTERKLDEESNIQFGEGGAGAFSDGKLTTGIKDPRCRQILLELVEHGAPEDILVLARPHVGTDRLPQVVRAIREEIVALGGQVLFCTKWTELILEKEKLQGIIIKGQEGERKLFTSCVLAAIGHSAEDTQCMLIRNGINAKRKPFSIGFRIEHLQSEIDRTQYGTFAGHPNLPSAEYKLHAHLPDGRGVYTFCMCPGGTVVPAASRLGGVCVNGMSPYHRDGRNANAAVLVDVYPEDFPGDDIMAGYAFQAKLEQAAFFAGGCDYSAPCQLVRDFLQDQVSSGPDSVFPTYQPGVRWANLNELFPQPWKEDLKTGLMLLNRQLPGFTQWDAVLTAPETRSSSPIRFCRNEKLQTNIQGLYLIGEGAGYAGGIMSSAVDGLRCAESALKWISGKTD